MNLLDKWNDVTKYIEDNLDSDIDLNYISKMVYCNTFHFLKMFSYLTDMTLNEYIKRRRMTKASEELLNSKIKVIDLAIKYGYDSPTSFNRAFKSIIGLAPSEVRKNGVSIKAYTPISFKIFIKGECEMKYRIEKKESFKVVGVKRHYKDIDDSLKEIPKFWNEIHSNNVIPKLCELMTKEPLGILGVCSSTTDKSFDYYVAVSTNKETPKDFEELVIPASTWAIFECVGANPEAIQSIQKRIMTEWLPNSEYKLDNGPDIELYFEGDQSKDDYRCEVWIPIK